MKTKIVFVVLEVIKISYFSIQFQNLYYQTAFSQICYSINKILAFDLIMEIEQDIITSGIDELINKFLNFSITSSQHQTIRKQSNILIAGEMPYQINPDHISQFNHLYLDRLANLSQKMPFNKSYKIQEVEGRLGTINIVGILKRLEVRRVRAFEKGFLEYYANAKTIYDEQDSLQLQDATGKLRFQLNPGATLNGHLIKSTDLPYGVIIGLTGQYCEQRAQFIANKLTLPNLPPQKLFAPKIYQENRKSLIVSSPSIPLIKFILRQLCSTKQMILSTSIKSMIIMGFAEKIFACNYRQLDDLFQKYGKSIDIFLMPNHNVAQIYPQKPIHPILFPKSYKKINLVSNPQIFYPNSQDQDYKQIKLQTLSGSILISSGENVKDLIKNCSYGQSSLGTMQSILQYSHLAPTCPFSLKCQMMPQDYLVLQELPYVFVAGECQKTESRDFVTVDRSKKVRLVAIKNGQMILIDIDSHKVQQFQIGENVRNVQGL